MRSLWSDDFKISEKEANFRSSEQKQVLGDGEGGRKVVSLSSQ